VLTGKKATYAAIPTGRKLVPPKALSTVDSRANRLSRFARRAASFSVRSWAISVAIVAIIWQNAATSSAGVFPLASAIATSLLSSGLDEGLGFVISTVGTGSSRANVADV
jgi:hypothetical protein